AMAANPIGVITIAIVALIAAVYALYKNWDKVSAFFIASGAKIKGFFIATKEFLKKWGVDLLLVLAGPFVGWPILAIKHFDKIKQGVGVLKDGVVEIFNNMGE